jgi:transcriptional regulator with XRE-family HTH domain
MCKKGGVNMPQITLKAARVNAGLTQSEVAGKLKISTGTLKNWEKGKTFPKQPQIEALCELYSVTYDNLFFN